MMSEYTLVQNTTLMDHLTRIDRTKLCDYLLLQCMWH